MTFLRNAKTGVAFALFATLSASAEADQAESTREMASMLSRAAEKEKQYPHPYLANVHVPELERQFAQAKNVAQKFESGYKLAETQIQANLNAEAIQTLDTLDLLLASLPPDLKAKHFDPLIRKAKGLAWLRFGEQENCVLHHSSDSCLFPIADQGIHTEQQGSKTALDLFLEQSDNSANHGREQWLAHIAAMTLGDWEQRIPEPLRIDPKNFQSEYPLPRFKDVSMAAGIDKQSLSGGGATIDFDNDGFLDLVISSWGLEDQFQFFRNKGDGTFENRTEQAGLTGITGGLNLIVADYNNDGFQDVFLLRGAWLNKWGYQPNSLLKNNGDGTFRDVTQEAGILSFQPTQTAVFADFNSDGWLDLFIGNETIRGDRHNCELYLNNGDGSFRDATRDSGIKIYSWIKGVAVADYDNDGDSDLYLSALGQANILLRNDGVARGRGWQFTDVTQHAGVTEPIHSFPCWFWDYDNDGWEDLFAAGFKINDIGDIASAYLEEDNGLETPRLYRNNRNGTFSDVSASSGLEHCWLPMGANFGDLDNDGFLDFYVGTGDTPMDTILPNKMYRNNDGKGFQDVTTAGGFGHLQKGHAVSFADYDNDGDQDVHIVMGGAYSGDRYTNALFQNPGNGNNWLKLSLEGTESPRDATGARIHLITRLPDGSQNSIHRTVTTGGSFGCNPMRLEIGLGPADQIHELNIRWPSGKQQSFSKVVPNRFYKVLESSNHLAHLALPATELCEPESSPNHKH